MRPIDWLLLLLDGDGSLDRVRIQKAMFLFGKRTHAPEDEKYDFVPYHYGPFSFDIYPDLDRLVVSGAVTAESAPGIGGPSYRLTEEGRRAAHRMTRLVPEKRLELLRSYRAFVLARNFTSLLEDIYRMYPDFAARSVFRKP